MWLTGSGGRISLDEMKEKIASHTKDNGSIFVGCDSQIRKEHCTFCTVVCLIGADDQKGGYYFFKREKESRNTYTNLLVRMLKEVECSVNMAYEIMEEYPNADIEIHIDANSRKGAATSKYYDTLVGYATGAGFKCKVKPDAWASSSIADKHSK